MVADYVAVAGKMSNVDFHNVLTKSTNQTFTAPQILDMPSFAT